MKLSALYNPLVAWLLRSPLHGLVSQSLMLVTLTGRKSGRPVTLPVNYYQRGNDLIAISQRGRTWWRNLRGGAPVTLCVQGRERRGTGEAIAGDDPAVVEDLAWLLEQQPEYARYLRVGLDSAGRPNPQDVACAAASRVIVRFHFNGGRVG